MTPAGKDVLIIGSGAGGSSLALPLARAGVEVAVLEKGRRFRREDFDRDEIAATRRDFFKPSPYRDPHALQRRGDSHAIPTDMGWTASCVGGGTVIMAAYLYRLHPDDFRMRERFGAYEEMADWPYTYEELEPWYCRAEWELGVSGSAGSNPFEGYRSQPYPMPPLRSNRLAGVFDEACRKLGLHPFPTPRGINSQPYEGRQECQYCAACTGYGCRAGARGTAQETLLAKAERTGYCQVVPDAMVKEITVDERGRASGCIYFDREGREHRMRARVVCVCCSAIETARLLLMSRSKAYPNGLSNNGGQVGRHLQFHSTSGGLGYFRYDRHPAELLEDPTPFLGRSVMDHYFLPEGISDLPKGGLFRFGVYNDSRIGLAQRLAEEGPKRLWGRPLKEKLGGFLQRQRVVDFEVFHDFVPTEHTFVELDEDHRDRWGLPIARIHLDEPEHHRKSGQWLLDRCIEILGEMGVDEVDSTIIGQPASILFHGTCRAGNDPESSALDPSCRSHEVPNLYVADGSFMPTSGGAPPTLTIVANGFRTADLMLARAKQGAFN